MVIGQRGLRLRVRSLLTRLILALLRQIPDLVAQDPADRADRGEIEFVAHPVGQQSVPNLPGENARVPLLVSPNVFHYGRGGDSRLAAADSTRQNGACLVVAGQNLAHAAMRDPQLPADITRPDSQLCQLYNPEADGVG